MHRIAISAVASDSHVGGVGDHDAARLGGRQIAVVDPDREVGDDAQGLGQARDGLGAQVLGVARQDGVGVGAELEQLLGRIEPVVQIELGPVVAREPRLHPRRQLAPDDDDRFLGHGDSPASRWRDGLGQSSIH